MDLRQIKNLMKEFEDSKIHKLEINDNDFSIKLEKEDKTYIGGQALQMQAPSAVVPASANAPVVTEPEVNDNFLVKAPLVGTYYEASSPDSEPFCKVGQDVSKGDVLFIVEAMKVMNEITAPVSGTIMKRNVSDASMVEYGQVVVEIKE